ncbi:MAG TPA: TIR domain-containing protein, partial [Chitinophagales bacterium]|nr:TIR domain-containing protein [Chitinophagales bacterium]
MHPFTIYVVWHPLFSEGRTYAEMIYQTYSRNFKEPFNRSLGIPVYYRSIGASGNEDEMPKRIDPDAAAHTAIVVLIDDYMVVHRDEWQDYLEELVAMDKENDCLRIFPVAIAKNATSINNLLSKKNFIRVFDKEQQEQQMRFVNISLAHEFCRLLHGFERASDDKPTSLPRLKLFLSHSKADGVEITKLLKYWVQEFTGLQSFFDATDIPPGESFGKVISEGVVDSTLLVIQTDIYSTREWCRTEVLEAKKNRRPVVVVNALDKGESRSFPYMCNVPVIRWATENASDFSLMIERIILAVLLETLRHRYQEYYVDYLFKTFLPSAGDFKILKNAPELLDLVGEGNSHPSLNDHYLYPDPPLGDGELQLLQQFNTTAKFSTPVQLIREASQQDPAQQKFRIGISISESGMMESRGLSIDHLKDIMVEAARYLLASGHSLAYGGDIAYSDGFNFVMLLKEMVTTYRSDYKTVKNVVTNFVAFPLNNLVNPSVEADLIDQVKFVRIPPPENLSINIKRDWQRILKSETVADQYLFAQCLTEMRIKMNQQIDARIILGGKLTGFKGKYPGLVEETLLAMHNTK